MSVTFGNDAVWRISRTTHPMVILLTTCTKDIQGSTYHMQTFLSSNQKKCTDAKEVESATESVKWKHRQYTIHGILEQRNRGRASCGRSTGGSLTRISSPGHSISKPKLIRSSPVSSAVSQPKLTRQLVVRNPAHHLRSLVLVSEIHLPTLIIKRRQPKKLPWTIVHSSPQWPHHHMLSC